MILIKVANIKNKIPIMAGLIGGVVDLVSVPEGLDSIGGVDPVHGHRLPAVDFVGLEPEPDLVLGRVHGVGPVADVAADLMGKRKERK